MTRSHDAAYNRDEDQKPREPRSAAEPAGSKASGQTAKTLTDPASGETRQEAHAPNQANADQSDGAGDGRAKARDRNLPPA